MQQIKLTLDQETVKNLNTDQLLRYHESQLSLAIIGDDTQCFTGHNQILTEHHLWQPKKYYQNASFYRGFA